VIAGEKEPYISRRDERPFAARKQAIRDGEENGVTRYPRRGEGFKKKRARRRTSRAKNSSGKSGADNVTGKLRSSRKKRGSKQRREKIRSATE